MDFSAHICVVEHRGWVVGRQLAQSQRQGRRNRLMQMYADPDLASAAQTEAFFAHRKPDYVFLDAANFVEVQAGCLERAVSEETVKVFV